MTPSTETKEARMKAANARVKTLDTRIGDLEKRLAVLRRRRIDAAAHAKWLSDMPNPVGDVSAAVVEPAGAPKDGAL